MKNIHNSLREKDKNLSFSNTTQKIFQDIEKNNDFEFIQENSSKQKYSNKFSDAIKNSNIMTQSKKKVLQNKVYQVAREMGIEEEENTLTLSYFMAEKLSHDIQKATENNLGIEQKREVIKRFVKQRIEKAQEGNIIVTKNHKNKSTKKKNSSIMRRKTKKNQKGIGGIIGKICAGAGILYWVATA